MMKMNDFENGVPAKYTFSGITDKTKQKITLFYAGHTHESHLY